MENSNLVKLIKSLKKNEKRYVAIYLSKHKSGNNLLKLYNVINDSETVSDEVIARKIKDKKVISQLKINKHNLYYLLLDALHNFHLRGSVYGRVLNLLHQAEILSSKGLNIARKDLLDKAAKLADEYELSELKLEILRLQNHEPSDINVSNTIHKETRKLAARITEEDTIKHFNNRLSLYQRKVGQRLTPTQMKYLEKEMLSTIKKLSFSSNSFFNQFFYFRILSLYHTMSGNTYEAFDNDMKLTRIFKENPKMLDLQIWKDRYLSAISRLITSSSLVGKNDMLPFLSNEIQNLDISDKRKAFADINILDAYMQVGEFENSYELVKQVEENTDFYHRNLGPANRTALYFNLAVLNFGLENYSKSLQWINNIINNPDNHSENMGIHFTIRILRLILYYELQYFDLLEYELRSTYRYIIKEKNPYKFDQAVFSFIRRTVSVYDKAKIRKAMEQTRTDLVKISKIKTEQQTISYFDFISWLSSKIENKKFADLVRQRAQSQFKQEKAA